MLLLVLCFAEAGSLFDQPGGAIVYTRAAFGEFVGFEVGWMTWIARISSIASLSVFFARAVGYLWVGARSGLGQQLTIVFAASRSDGDQRRRGQVGRENGGLSRSSERCFRSWSSSAVGLFFVSWDRVFPVPAPERGNLTKAALLVLFAYAGFENTAAPAGEFVNPKRDIPFALIVQIVDRDGDLHGRAARGHRNSSRTSGCPRRRSRTRPR